MSLVVVESLVVERALKLVPVESLVVERALELVLVELELAQQQHHGGVPVVQVHWILHRLLSK